jgi:hypothetical protein
MSHHKIKETMKINFIDLILNKIAQLWKGFMIIALAIQPDQ